MIGILAISSCNYSKHVKSSENPNATLLWQNRIILKNRLESTHRDEVITQINAALLQKPNQAIFGLDIEAANIGYKVPRFKLFLYNLLHRKIERDMRKDSNSVYLTKKIAERPIILDTNKKNTTVKIIKSILFNNGYFYAKVKDSTVTKRGNKTSVYYVIEPNKTYKIKKVNYICNNTEIKNLIQKDSSNSLLYTGAHLSRAGIATEVSRLSLMLNNNGYFNMNPSAIRILTDTINIENLKNIDDPFATLFNSLDSGKKIEDNLATIDVIIKDSLNELPIKQYTFGNIKVIYTDKLTAKDIDFSKYKSATIDGVEIIADHHPIDPKLIANNIYFRTGDIFNLTALEQTLNRLNRLQILRNTNIDVAQIKKGNIIDYIVYINLGKRFVYEANLEASQANNYNLGNDIRLSITDNNSFNKAVRTSLSLNGGVQAIFNPKVTATQYYASTRADARVPKALLIDPFLNKKDRFKISSNLSAGYSYHNIINAFIQKDASGSFNYNWAKNSKTTFIIAPIILNFLRTTFVSDTKRDSFLNNEFLRQSLKDFAIFGSGLGMEHTNKTSNFQKYYAYYRINVEKAGAIARELFPKYNIAQYIKIDNEVKLFTNRRKSSWVNRGLVSLGIPLNNSNIPFLKLQSSGGLNGMRGWDANELGPGRTRSIDVKTISERAKNRGDLKLEFNSEYRYNIVKLFGGFAQLGGQFFAEAGNIWRLKDSANNFAAQFKFNKLGKDIAANIGTGLRVDFSFFLIRVEYGVRIKQPYREDNDGWTKWNEPFNKSWRRSNSRWQVGIGYPF